MSRDEAKILNHKEARAKFKKLVDKAVGSLAAHGGKLFADWSESDEVKEVHSFLKDKFRDHLKSGWSMFLSSVIDEAKALEIFHSDDGDFRIELSDPDAPGRLSSALVTWWAGVPRPYTFVFPMPNIEEWLGRDEEILVGDRVRIAKASFAGPHKGDRSPLGEYLNMLGQSPIRDVPAFHIQDSGIVRWGWDEELVISSVIRTCKVLVTLADVVDAIDPDVKLGGAGSALATIEVHSAEPLSDTVNRVALPPGLSATLSRMSIANAVLSPLTAFPTPDSPGKLPNEDDKGKDVAARLRCIGIAIDRARKHASLREKPKEKSKEQRRKLMTPAEANTALDAHCERVVTSAAWLFDAEDDTAAARAYMQLAIGFEAIYGNSGEKPNLVDALCDRVSFALGSSVADREQIHRRFEHFYHRRSKIVHTGLSRLDEGDESLFRWGKETLRRALKHELALIEKTHDDLDRARRMMLAGAILINT